MINQNLKYLVKLDIPKPIKKQFGFLDVIKKTQDETINSSIYAYFLNAFENAVLSEIFLKSLLNLLRIKYKIEFELDEFDPLTEVTTNRSARIDIVLMQRDRQKAIIIENKINHKLLNPLADYWNHYNEINNLNKLGILLTLKSHLVEDKFVYSSNEKENQLIQDKINATANTPGKTNVKFVNITHLEWINEIKSNGLPFDLDPRTHIYLNDFFKTMENISKVAEMDENVKFYFEHAARIQDAINTKENALFYIQSELTYVSNELNNQNGSTLEVLGNGGHYRNIRDKNRKTYYTITFEGFLKGHHENFIIIEMESEDFKHENDIRDTFKDDSDFNNSKISIVNGRRDKFRVHFAFKRMEFNILDKKERLGDYILREITTNFQPVMDKILNYIDSKKGTA